MKIMTKKVVNYVTWSILMHLVPNIFNNLKLKFPLHLRNCQWFIESVNSSKNQELWDWCRQELMGDAIKPSRPIRLCSQILLGYMNWSFLLTRLLQINSPSVHFLTCILRHLGYLGTKSWCCTNNSWLPPALELKPVLNLSIWFDHFLHSMQLHPVKHPSAFYILKSLSHNHLTSSDLNCVGRDRRNRVISGNAATADPEHHLRLNTN